MEETLKYGTSIKDPRPSNPDLTTNLGTLEVQEKPTTCKSGAPTQDGGKSSDIEDGTSKTLRTTRFLMLLEEKMLKVKRLSSGEDTTNLTKDGELPMLTKLESIKRVVFTETSDGILIDLSISDQECQ
jgi:hypothetical protein